MSQSTTGTSPTQQQPPSAIALSTVINPGGTTTWMEYCLKKGICPGCRIQTHKATRNMFRKSVKALNNRYVRNGVCLNCYPIAATAAPIQNGTVVDCGQNRETVSNDNVDDVEGSHVTRSIEFPTDSLPDTVVDENGCSSVENANNNNDSHGSSSGANNINNNIDDDEIVINPNTPLQTNGNLSNLGRGPMRYDDESLVDLPRDVCIEDVQNILRDMVGFKNDVQMQLTCCQQLRCTKMYITDEVADGIIKAVVEALHRHTANHSLVVECLGVLWKLAADDEDTKIQIARAHAFENILNCLLLHFSLDVSDFTTKRGTKNILEWVCGTLASLALADANTGEIIQSQVLKLIVPFLDKYMNEDGIFECTGKFLWGLAMSNNARRYMAEFQRFKLMDILTRTMDDNLTDHMGLEWACRFIVIYECYDSDIISEEDISKIISTVSVIVRLDSGKCDLLRWAWRLFFYTCVYNKSKCPMDEVCHEIPVIFDSIKRNPSDINAQLWCLRILVEIFSRNNVTDIAKIKLEQVKQIFKIIETSSNRMAKTLASCFIYHISTGPQHHKHMLVDCGVIKKIINAMVKNASNDTLEEAGCFIIQNLSSDPEFARMIEEANAIKVIQDLYGKHPNSLFLGECLCMLISNIGASGGKEVGKATIGLISRNMKKQPKELNFQIAACHTLGNLFLNEDYSAILEIDAIVTSILTVMDAFPNETTLQETALFALFSMSMNDLVKPKVYSRGAVELIMNAMQNHPKESMLLRYAYGLLSTLAEAFDVDNISEGGECFQLIMEGMEEHLSDEILQAWACASLNNLANVNVGIETPKIRRGLFIVIKAMTEHSTNEDVQKEGCAAFWSFSGYVFYQEHSTLTSVINLITRALKKFSKNEELQTLGFGALHQITSDKMFNDLPYDCKANVMDLIVKTKSIRSNRSTGDQTLFIHSLGILFNISLVDECNTREALVKIIDVMSQNSRVTQLQEKGCELLSKLSSYQLNEATRILKNGVAAICEAMRQYPSNRDLQSNACTALSNFLIDMEINYALIFHGGVFLITQAIRTFQSDQSLLISAFVALRKLLPDVDSSMISDCQLIEVMMESMADMKDTSIKVEGLAILEIICKSDYSMKLVITNVDFLSDILETHLPNPIIQERVLKVLYFVYSMNDGNEFYRSSNIKTTMIRAVINGMMAHLDNAAIQKLSCDMLHIMSKKFNQEKIIRDEGGMNAIVFTTQVHYDSEDVQIHAFNALVSIVMSSERDTFCASSDEIDAVVRAVKRHSGSVALQEIACKALKVFVSSPNNTYGITCAKSIRNHLKRAARLSKKCGQDVKHILSLCDDCEDQNNRMEIMLASQTNYLRSSST